MAIIKVKTGGITADAITSTEIADNAVVTAAINADAVTDAKIADDVVGTEHLTANEVDTAALGADAVTGAQLADNAVNSEHYTDGSIDTAHIADAQITAAKLASGVGGKVLQVISTPKTDRFSTSSTSFTDVSGLSVNITPAATSSKIFVMMDVVGGPGNNVSMFLRLMRDSTAIHVATGSVGNRFTATAGASDDPSNQFPLSMTASVLDSPSSTSQITYKVQMATEASGNTGTCHINRSGEDQNNTQNGYFASSITVMEVSA